MLSYIKAVILAIIGGASAVLPLSATVNVSFLNRIFGGSAGEAHYYLGMIMFGAAAAVLILYYRQIYDVLFSKSEKLKRKAEYGVHIPMFSFKDIMIGCAPLALLFFPIGKGVFLFNICDCILDGRMALVEGIALIASGVIYFIAFTNSLKTQKYKKFNPLSIASIGVVQMLSALVPGASRTALTFSVASLFRHRKNKAITYSYIIAFPALVFGSFLHIILGSATDAVIPISALILTFIISVFSSVFGMLAFSALAGEKKSKLFSYANVTMGIIAIISFAVRLFIK